jgi:hypothetical protein
VLIVALVAELTAAGEGEPDTLGISSLILAALAVLAAGIPALINLFSRRVRSAADITAAEVAENEGLKRSADTAIALVAEARANASQAVEMVKGSLQIAQSQIASQTAIIEDYKVLLAEARSASDATVAEHRARVVALEIRVEELTAERDARQAEIDEKTRELEEAEETIREMTLTPQQLHELVNGDDLARDEPVHFPATSPASSIIFPPPTDNEEQP